MEAAGLAVEQVLHFNRITRPGWWFTGRVLKRRSSSRVLLWFFDAWSGSGAASTARYPGPRLA